MDLTPYDKYRGHTQEQIERRVFHVTAPSTEFHKPLLAGGDVAPFRVNWGQGEYIKYGAWLGAPWEQHFFTQPRILVRQIMSGRPPRIYAGYTEQELYNIQSLFNILLNPVHKDISLKYLLGVLSSKLITFYHANRFLEQA